MPTKTSSSSAIESKNVHKMLDQDSQVDVLVPHQSRIHTASRVQKQSFLSGLFSRIDAFKLLIVSLHTLLLS